MPRRSFRISRDASKSALSRAHRRRYRFPIVKEAFATQSQHNEEEYENPNEHEQTHNGDVEKETITEKQQIIRYLRNDQNNAIERLLLYNANSLQYEIDHCDFPSFNVGIWPQENQELLATYPSCAFSVPRPIYVADGLQESVDLCFKRPMACEMHKIRMRKTRSAYYYALRNRKAIRTDEKEGIYHSAVFDIAERKLLQPDPYFVGSYDFYYTGGNLSTLPKTGSIVHASGRNLQTVELSEFPMIEDYTVTSSLRSIAKYTSPEDCEIFEVQAMLTSSDKSQQNCFIARQRNIVSLNFLNENKNIKILTQFRTKSTPFISFSQSERDHNKLLITTMKQHVRHYDISGNVPRLVKLFEIEPKATNVSWNTVKPWRENTFLYANENKFFLIDTRTTPDQWMPSTSSASDHIYLCDRISAVMPSDFNNLFYVATNHKLYCMDIRHIKTNSFNEPEAAICRWSHQLQYAPLMMNTYRLRNNEYIALSSPLAGDLHICQLSRKSNDDNLELKISNRVPKHIYSSRCMPYQPPTLLEAYECARLAGKCLQPEANLRSRLQACTTGLSFSKPSMEGKKAELGLLLTSNSLGDIFVHNLTKREGQEGESRGNTRSNELMAEFAKTLAQRKHPLNYTHIKKMKATRKVFLCKYLNAEHKLDVDAMDDSFSENDDQLQYVNTLAPPKNKKRKRLHLGRWQKSFATLHTYKDALVQDLLSIWDIDMEEDEKAIRLGDLKASLLIKPDPALKVRDWLDTNQNPNPPMTSIPSHEASKYMETTKTAGEADISLYLNETQNTMDFENAVQSTQIVDTTMQLDTSAAVETTANNNTTISLERSNIKKKSKKYVKGF